MTKAWRITKADSTDLGLAVSACSYQAVTLAEFRAWAEMVVLATPDDLPPYKIDYMVGTSPESAGAGSKIFGSTGFMPYDPVLERRSHTAALTGIGHTRGIVDDSGHDPWITKQAAPNALKQHSVVTDRFKEVFPTLSMEKNT